MTRARVASHVEGATPAYCGPRVSPRPGPAPSIRCWHGCSAAESSPSAVMTYAVKELFYTLQGEGAHAGRPAVFLRFAGCNLWSGREQDRRAALCRFCDTDF